MTEPPFKSCLKDWVLMHSVDEVDGISYCNVCLKVVQADTCYCGASLYDKYGCEGHDFTPMGCICKYAEPPVFMEFSPIQTDMDLNK